VWPGNAAFPKEDKAQKNAHFQVLGVYCTVGNTGCIPEGKEEQADLGRIKENSDGAVHWREELGGGRLRYL